MSDQDVFYGTLASWWPLISPVEEYAEEAQWVGKLLARAARDVREVLELGSGGGHCAHHLNGRFAMTLVDRSASMLAVSQALNPGCRHVVGDMRTLRLAERFDAVFIYDAVDYLISEAELSEAFATARAHCRPGGVVVVIPDHVREAFEPGADFGGSDAPDGRGARLFEWSHDPDPDDDVITTDYAFMLRAADGQVSHHHETHVTGLFAEARWVALLDEAGFEVEVLREETDEDREPRHAFLGHVPQS